MPLDNQEHSESGITQKEPDSVLITTLWMISLVAGTHLASQFILDYGWVYLFVLSIFLGAFVYKHLIESAMFVRLAVADSGFRQGSLIHRWMSKGMLTKVRVLTISILFSGSFLFHANQMPLYVWFIVYLDVFIIIGLFRLTKGQVETQAKRAYSSLIGRKYVFGLNIILLTSLICIVGLFEPVPNIQDLSLVESFKAGWASVSQYEPDLIIEIWGGLIAGLDSAGWNLIQQTSALQFNGFVKFIGWILFFIIQSIYLWVIQAGLLGVFAINESNKSWTDTVLGKSSAAKWGWGTFFALIAVSTMLNLVGSQQQEDQASQLINFSGESTPQKLVIDPCEEDVIKTDVLAVEKDIDQNLLVEKEKYTEEVDRTIDEQVDGAFRKATEGIDSYLDWYYSTRGEWTRLGTVVVGDPITLIQEKKKELIYDSSGFTSVYLAAKNRILRQANYRLVEASKKIISIVKYQAVLRPCSVEDRIDIQIPSLSKDLKRLAMTSSASAAAGIAVLTSSGAAVATKLAASVTTKVVSKVVTKVAAKTATKAAGGAAGAWAGGLIGLSCGPYAPICSTGLAVVGFIGVDALFIKGDEMIYRDEMRNDMIKAITERRDQIKEQLKVNYHKAGESFFVQIKVKAGQLFIPIKDGL